MKKETAKYIRLVYGILLGLMTVAAGICLMAGCISIYRSGGEQIYTAEKVAAAFLPISGWIYGWLVMALLGWILALALPSSGKKRKAEKDYAGILERLLAKRDITAAPAEVQQAIARQWQLRRRDRMICLILLGICSAGFLAYGVNPANFHLSEINESMIKAVLILFGCLTVPFGFSVFAAYRSRASYQREIELVKPLPVVEKQSGPVFKSSRRIAFARGLILTLAVIFLVYGFLAGGTADVLTKAINICTECVGLG